MRWLTCGLLLVLSVLPAAAQSADQQSANVQPSPAPSVADASTSPLADGAWELLATAGAAYGVVLFHSDSGHRYSVQSLSVGRVLSDLHGPGPLRGSFTWAFEIVPLFSQWRPADNYGIGVAPLVWRWNFAPYGRRISTYAEIAGGGLWTSNPIPTGTTDSNFTAHAAYGLRYFVRPHQAFVVTYWLHHISNGNRLDRNPGVNAHVVQVGFSYVRPK